MSVRQRPRKLASEEQLYAYALRALTRRAHSVYEMRQALERRLPDGAGAEQKALAAEVISRLREKKYLDDERYARQFARSHAVNRKQGRFRIARELRARGVAGRHIETALEELFAEADEAALVRARLARKLKARGGPVDARRMASLYASLLRAGFPSDLIRRELRAIARISAEEVPEITTEE
ncbi:MAG: RecX family transcriptional regulator [Acidobacteria bacterium]|nr:RecX family transcriptional regulator [Acidobacteriota bacterium]